MLTGDRSRIGVGALVLVGLAALVALPAIVATTVRGFDGLYGQDAFAYTDYALGPLRTALAAGQWPPAFFWPPGFPMAVAVTGSGQLVALAAGAAVPVLTVVLALSTASDRGRAATATAWLAGAVAAVSGQLWQSSVVAMSDTLGIAVVTVAAIAAARHAGTGRWRWLLLTAVGCAGAIEVRWVYGLVAMPVVGLAAWTFVGRWRQGGDDRRSAVVQLAGGAIVGIVVLLPTVLPMLDAARVGATIPFTADFAAYRWDPASAFRSTIDTLDGHLGYALPTGAFYVLQPVAPYWAFGLGLLTLPGLVRVVRTSSAPRLALLVAWPALVLGFLVGGGNQNTRFFLAMWPPVAILIAIGAAWLWEAAGRGRHGRTVVAGLLALGLLVNAAAAARFTDGFIVRQAHDLAAIRSLAARVPGDARILTIGATPVLRHDGRADVVELFDLDEAAARALADDPRTEYVLVDLDAIHGQWVGTTPGRAVTALEADPGLLPIATAGTWTLARVAAER